MSGSLPPRQHAFNGQQMMPGAGPGSGPVPYALSVSHMPQVTNGQYHQAGPLPSPQFYAQQLAPPPSPLQQLQQPPQIHGHHAAHPSHFPHMNSMHPQQQQQPQPQHSQPPQLQQHRQHQQHQQHQLPQQSPISQHLQPPGAPKRFQPQQTPPQHYMPYPVQRSHSPMIQQPDGTFQFQHNGMPASAQMPSPVAIPGAGSTPSPVPSHLPSPIQYIPQRQQQRLPQPQVIIPSKPLSMYTSPSPTLQYQRIPQQQQQQQQQQQMQMQERQFQQQQQQQLQLQLQMQRSHQQHMQDIQGAQTAAPEVFEQSSMPSPSVRQYSQPVIHIPALPRSQQQQQFQQQQQQQRYQRPPVTPTPIASPLPTASPRISAKGGVQKPLKSPRKHSISSVGVSPKIVPKRSPAEAAALLICVADDCLSKAQSAAPGLAKSRDEGKLREYYKLMATGLGCLDAALRSGRFPPRVEVKIRIRYASILSEETENLMQAETTLQLAVATCEKYRLADLRPYVHFLFMKVLFRRKPKAALIAIQGHIEDCSGRSHTYWTYAFRFLKVFFYFEAGTPADTHALENLHAISILAEQRGDRAVYVLASLLQALALFRTTDGDVVEKVHTCIAAASKYQLDESVHIPQLDVLWHLLDLSCSFYLKEKALTDKMNALQSRLEELKESPLWASDSSELLLPLKRDATGSASTISEDTGDVLRPGEKCDYLVLSSFSKVKAFILGFTFSGLTLASRQQMNDRRSLDYWAEALKMISQSANAKPATPIFIHEAADGARWRAAVASYILVLTGLNAATHCDWAKVQECTIDLERSVKEADDGPLEVLALYLKGVLSQGTGELQEAIDIFEDEQFSLAADAKPPSNEGHVKQEIALLAAMNRLLIMQVDRLRNEPKINELVEQLKHLCVSHTNPEIRTAYSLVMAAINTQPPLSMHDIKMHIQQGLNGSTTSGNAQCLNIALNTMRYRLFENVVGDQALKSAKAGSTQAKKSGNILWMSVADGMLADTYEVQGQTAQAQISRQSGIQYANDSWESTQV